MQIKHLFAKRNKVWGIDEAEYSAEAYEKEKKDVVRKLPCQRLKHRVQHSFDGVEIIKL